MNEDRREQAAEMSRKIISFHVAIVLFLLTIMTVGPAAACTLPGNHPSQVVLGFTVYSQTLWTTIGLSGRKLGAYAGIHVGSLEECLQKCEADSQCSGMTKRPTEYHGPRNCLKFSRTDYQTGEKRRSLVAHFGGVGHYSAIVRTHNGRLCNR